MRRRGFTLLELCLVIGLMVVLTTMAMPLFTAPLARRQLVESAQQFRSLMYLTAAEAKQRGRRLELRFVNPPATALLPESPAAQAVEVHIERDPLGAPGVFDLIQADWARWSVCASNIQITRVQAAEASQVTIDADPVGGPADQTAASEPTPIIFGADGRSQVGDVSVTVINDQFNGYCVRLRGTTGLAKIEAVARGDQAAEASMQGR